MKKIITCCDGTWNKPGQRDNGVVTQTNVQKISHLICSSDPEGITQLTHYHPGVGTSGDFWSRFKGGVSGAGLNDDIIDAYRFIVLNYEEGDLNYLIGFSRGAYTARSLGGFIVNCGILKKEHIGRMNEAFTLYRDRDSSSHPNASKSLEFKAKYSHEPAIHFIGVWDTVGALGIPLQMFAWLNAKKFKFHDTQLSSIVRFAYQAIAIDEHRKIFNASLWERSENGKKNIGKQTIRQKWFPGAHCNVGGGYKDDNLSDNALLWMIEMANGAGLSFNQLTNETVHSDVINGILRNSNTIWWSWLHYFVPFFRKIALKDPDYVEQSISWAATKRREENPAYRPPNLP